MRFCSPAGFSVVVLAALGALTACSDTKTPEGPPTTLTVTSSDFTEGATIPADFTCKGAGRVPSLSWSGDTKGAKALAVVVDDPDAPSGTYVHWIVLDLPASATALSSNGVRGLKEAKNSASEKGWTPPCPPSGTHHYRFTVYALKQPTGLGDGAERSDALDAIGKNSVASGRLTGVVEH
ncbi:YbhB/YbcL family Raf kinase inhibitor-like protein [Dactylosporangium sp. CA-139066]|uniref:YbhB/YbcL family Raf kinase inhibitor-like protein n=1 Tax=Dactylosporangium sp. CA-139066 TaxID=3239930 RepID=UPI003D92EA46